MEEQAAAAHVLICCDESLRLYPAEGIRVGDRWAGFTASPAAHPFSPSPLPPLQSPHHAMLIEQRGPTIHRASACSSSAAPAFSEEPNS